MPKQTFFNLPHEKKQMLIRSAEAEFSRVPLYQASISNIVKEAGIPRGSFYQYFQDKEDAFFFLLDDLSRKRQEVFINLLKKYDGDLFTALEAFFQVAVTEVENLDFMRNTFLNMTYRIEESFLKMLSGRQNEKQFREVSTLIDKRKLNLSGDKELYHMMIILTSVIVRNFVEKFARGLPDEEAINNFKIEMKLLKKGLYYTTET
ncbi:DNA-binding transcriptional regulator, AcrR family [Lentibacillus persicus]|uniref:DNA-binding transcriptional regulator, AcrR family n=1 Tax=Lentibacillus persicus TaxID=640948 RepID=A0A1I1UEM0_9BACI|nr:TetR family transcriptional regulator [Lentibacillus persicus]SFD69281.1 DNA-binding transcriptional regulator, AcrR family [Lentibacillus persicus]